jgi:DNA-directed RNA polymerase specialized sigma24 family protein
MKDNEIARDYKSIREDYRFDASIFTEEPDRTARVKWIIDNRLTDVERILILLYVDCQSFRKLGKRLGLSHQTCAKEVRRIKEKILQEYSKLIQP